MLTITDQQRVELSKWAASRTLPAGDVFRARLILALADGQSYSQIKASLRTTAPTISRWIATASNFVLTVSANVRSQ